MSHLAPYPHEWRCPIASWTTLLPSLRATCYADPSRLIFIDEGNLRPARSIPNRVSHCLNLIARILRQTLRRVRFRVGWSFNRYHRNIRCAPIDTDCKGRHHATHKATSLDNDSWITELGRVKRPFAWRNAFASQRRDSADQAEEWRYASKELHNVGRQRRPRAGVRWTPGLAASMNSRSSSIVYGGVRL